MEVQNFFETPDYWGIGKSVSWGFGTVRRVETRQSLKLCSACLLLYGTRPNIKLTGFETA